MQTFILSDCDSPVNMIYYKYLTNYNMCTQMTQFNMSAYYLKHWPINQSWHCWESFETKDTKRCILNDVFGSWKRWENVEARTIDGAFWRYLKRCSCSWNCWEHLKKQGRKMVHSGAIWNDFSEVGTAEKLLKDWRKNNAFWCYLKRCFGSWNCLENLKPRKHNGAFGRFSKNVVDDFQGSY